MDKCAIFIDEGYINKVVEYGFNKVKINFNTLSDNLCCGKYSKTDKTQYHRFRTFYYYAPPYVSHQPTPEERERQSKRDSYIKALESYPRFQTRKGKLEKRGSEFTQKRVDILLAVDLVKLSATRQINKAILIAGDSDYVPAIETAKESINVHLYYYKDGNVGVHDELIEVCDDRDIIDQKLIDDSLL